MKLSNQNALFADLTQDEQAVLNGGYYCRYIYFWRRICYGYTCYWQWAYAWQCS